MIFRGTFDHTLDSKNRLTVPAKFRPSLSDGVVLAQGIEQCVTLWTPADYNAHVEAVLAGRNPASRESRELRRFYSANAFDTELDGAGRVMLPAFLIAHAELGREVVVTGGHECLEIWARERWNAHNDDLVARVDHITAALDHPS